MKCFSHIGYLWSAMTPFKFMYTNEGRSPQECIPLTLDRRVIAHKSLQKRVKSNDFVALSKARSIHCQLIISDYQIPV